MDVIFSVDSAILLWIQDHLRLEAITPIMKVITKMGSLGMIWIFLSLALLCFKKTRPAGAAALLSLIFSLLLNNMILKNLFARVRPYEMIPQLELLVEKAKDWSFPSGHTGSSFAAATAICFMLKGQEKTGWKWLVLAFAFLMAFTRLYIGIHYPSDILGGMATGTLCGWLAAKIACAIQRQCVTKN